MDLINSVAWRNKELTSKVHPLLWLDSVTWRILKSLVELDRISESQIFNLTII